MEKILAERKKRYEVEFNFVKATTELTKFNLEKKYPEELFSIVDYYDTIYGTTSIISVDSLDDTQITLYPLEGKIIIWSDGLTLEYKDINSVMDFLNLKFSE